MKKIKKIGVLTSGGDCGGLNAAIKSIFLTAKKSYNIEVHGIKNGTLGLIKRPLDVEKLTYKSFEGFELIFCAHTPQDGSGVMICKAQSASILFQIFNNWRENFSISFNFKPALTSEELFEARSKDTFWTKE